MEPRDLYGLALDRFVAQRAALARRLRADGRREEAGAVAAMRKPSVAAWAVNQLVRTQGRSAQDLFDAGDALREAQEQLLAGGGDGRTLRAASERERAVVEELVSAARGLLSSEGQELSVAVIDRVADTLHAAALDEGAREQVREGVLERELRHVGLGLGESGSPDGAAPAPRAARSKPPATETPAKKPGKPVTAGRSAKENASTTPARTAPVKPAKSAPAKKPARSAAGKPAASDRAAARKVARTADASARRRVERAAHAQRAAVQRRERAVQALAEADEALAAARKEAEAATTAQHCAQADLRAL